MDTFMSILKKVGAVLMDILIAIIGWLFPETTPKRRKMLKKTRLQRILRWIQLPIYLLWLQIIFQLSTVGGAGGSFLFFGTLFVLMFSFFVEFILSWIPIRPGYVVIKGFLIGVCCVLITSYYFVFGKFNTFYDLNTVFGGAGGALGEFMGSIIRLVFSFNGILHIILFLAPLVFYIMVGSKIDLRLCKVRREERVNGGLCVIALWIFVMFWIRVLPNSWSTYKTEYNLTNAIEKFGVFEGLRLDMKRNGSKSTDFQIDQPTEETESAEPVVYGSNALNIDFNALAASTTNADLQALDNYVASLEPSKQNAYTGLFKGKNLIFITAEAFSAQAINSTLTPTLYRMATKGFQFTDYYQPESAGTTGGEYNNIFGMLPTGGGKSFKKAAANLNYMTMGWQLNLQGYWGKAYHNNTYDFYDRDKTHVTLGYSEGYMGYGNGMENYVTKKWPESDLEMIQGTLTEYIDQEHFNIYYMSVSGHSDYSLTDNAMAKKHAEEVASLNYSEPVKAYLACNIELNDAMEYLINALEEKGIADDTVIVIGSDHFPYGLDDGGDSVNMPYLSELYGQSIDNDIVRDQNRLIIWSGCLEKQAPVEIDTPTFSVDILPTLLNLFGVEYDSRLCAGRDVFSENQDPLVFDVNYDWKTEYGTYINKTHTFTPYNEVNFPAGYNDWDSYVEDVKKIVRNKMNYCSGVLDNDYYRHVFGENGEITYSAVSPAAAEPAAEGSSESAAEGETQESAALAETEPVQAETSAAAQIAAETTAAGA